MADFETRKPEKRDLTQQPITAWGRHELEVEVVWQRERIAELERIIIALRTELENRNTLPAEDKK